MKKIQLVLVTALVTVALLACAKKEEPVVNPTVKEAPATTKNMSSADSAAAAERERLEAERLAAERLEADRAKVEAMINKIMSDEVYFDFDHSELTASAKDLLTQVGDILLKEPRFLITVGGHTDERGTEDYNMTLGSKRSQKVKDFLVAYGISGDRMETISYGEEKPKVDGQTEDAFAQNRRANFKVSVKK
jgi:peptidoglycan-associated lipoprotein